MTENILYYGDNLDIMREHLAENSVDLEYLDPPFNSSAVYNVLFKETNGTKAQAQMKAFEDTWTWDETAARTYHAMVQHGGKVSQALQSFHSLLGEDNNMMPYLAMMAPRLVELHRVLKPTGSIYLHCDPTASHYLKVLMDAIFDKRHFRNEIVWCYRKWSVTQQQFVRNHDTILFYSKTDDNYFSTLYVPPSEGTMKRWRGRKQQAVFEDGIRKATSTTEEAKSPMPDWWQISILNPNSAERLGYPTQKPLAILDRIIEASCPEGGTVLDPFAGCGTSVVSAQKHGRPWIGIDITYAAIGLIKMRLKHSFPEGAQFKVVGEPTTVADAQALFKQDAYQFQWWALGRVGAGKTEQKRGSDKGIDGRLYFFDDPTNKTKQIIFSVKGGHTDVGDVRDLRGVIDRENAEIGVLITLRTPTRDMRTEALDAGYYTSPWNNQDYPRIQILTIKEILEGKKIDYNPAQGANVTFQKAPKVKKETGKQGELPI
jgi:DNA modification methylase